MQTITETSAHITPRLTVTTDAGDPNARVYVVATTRAATAHALKVGHALAAEESHGMTVLVFPPKPLTISSDRAGVHDLPVDDPDARLRATPEAVQALLASNRFEATVLAIDARTTGELVRMLPRAARVVLAGPMHHFVESREQRLARILVSLGYDVTFVPCPEE